VDVRVHPVIVEGRLFQPGSDEIIVGRGISSRFEHCRVGDVLRIQKRELKVVGLFSTGGSAYESEIWGDGRQLRDYTYVDDVVDAVKEVLRRR
jgi:putative ABC transport system permease protein